MRSDQNNISELIENLRIIIQKFSRSSNVSELATGLTGPQMWALQIIFNNSPIMISALARQMNLTPATTVGLINRLEAKKLVVRYRSKNDRRAVHLYLTETGTTLITHVPDVARDMLTREMSQLTEQQLSTVEEGLELMANLFKTHRNPLLKQDGSVIEVHDEVIYE